MPISPSVDGATELFEYLRGKAERILVIESPAALTLLV